MGTATCLYLKRSSSTRSITTKNIFIKTNLVCNDHNIYSNDDGDDDGGGDVEIVNDKEINTNYISSMEGPLLCLHNDTHGQCNKNITINFQSKYACPHWKMSSQYSYLECPKTFNNSVDIINCTLRGMSVYDNGRYGAGTMDTEVKKRYLNISAIMNYTTDSFDSLQYNLTSNQTGIFNISFNLTHLFNLTNSNNKNNKNNKHNEIIKSTWKGITIWANVSYENTGSKDNSNTNSNSNSYSSNSQKNKITLVGNRKYFINYTASTDSHGSSNNESSVDLSFTYAIIGICIFGLIHFVFRLHDSQARLFSNLCLKCQCCKYGSTFCCLGCYVCCCGCRMNKNANSLDLNVIIAGHSSLNIFDFDQYGNYDPQQSSDDNGLPNARPHSGRLNDIIFGFGSQHNSATTVHESGSSHQSLKNRNSKFHLRNYFSFGKNNKQGGDDGGGTSGSEESESDSNQSRQSLHAQAMKIGNTQKLNVPTSSDGQPFAPPQDNVSDCGSSEYLGDSIHSSMISSVRQNNSLFRGYR